jgi:effector-binding domain-containing protein
MPLARIGRVLELSGADAMREVAAFWAEAEADMAAKRRLVAYLERHLEGRGEPMYDVETRDVPEQHVATMQRNLTVGDLPAFIEEGWTRLGASVSDAGGTIDGPYFVIFHGEVNDDSDGPVELCLPYRGSVAPPDGGISVRTEPAHREAFTRLTRAQIEFPSILDAYGAVERWMEREGHEMAASPREVYFTEADVAPDEPFCDVAFPIR